MSWIYIDLKCDHCEQTFERIVKRDSLDGFHKCTCLRHETATRVPSATAGKGNHASPFMRRAK